MNKKKKMGEWKEKRKRRDETEPRIPGVEEELMMMMCECREDLSLLAATE